MNYYLIRYTKSTRICSGESLGSKYDLSSSCEKCGTGAELTGNLILNARPSPNISFFRTLDTDFVISEEIYNLLLTFLDLDLDKVMLKSGIVLPYYYFRGQTNLNKMRDSSKGIIKEDSCEKCSRDGYYGMIKEDSEYHYLKTDFKEDFGIYDTWERFASSNLVKHGNKVVRYARPSIIVDERVKEVIKKIEPKYSKFHKIVIV